MAIFVNQNTKVIVQGLTGGQGKYHGLRNKAYGTQVVTIFPILYSCSVLLSFFNSFEAYFMLLFIVPLHSIAG